MRIVVYLPLIIPMILAVRAQWLADRLAPRVAAWALALVTVALAACGLLMTGLVALAGAVQLPPVAAAGQWSVRYLRHAFDPGAVLIAVVAAVVLIAAVGGAGRITRSQVRTVLRSRGALAGAGTGELVVLPETVPMAYALPGRPGHVVVSTGMLAALDGTERRALIAHERAHLAGRHHLITAATRVAATVNPLLRPLHRAVVFSTERSADEHAARHVGSRRVTARAIAKAALAGQGGATGPETLPTATAGPVPRRIHALLAAPPAAHAWATALRVLAMLAVAATLVATLAATIEATTDFDLLLDLAHLAAQ